MIRNFFSKIVSFCEIMWENTVQPGRQQMTIWHMRFACWIPKATNTHSGYVKYFFVFPPQTVIARTRLNVAFIRTLSVLNYFIYQLKCTILYSLTICMLHYYPRHVSSINMPILRRKNCIHTASGIVALNRCTVQSLTESDDTRCCVNTICPPEDGHVNARNMPRIIV